MKTTAQKRLARLAGLLLLSLLVFATGVQAAQAVPQGLTPAQLHQYVGQAPSATGSGTGVTPAAGTQGRGGVALTPFAPAPAAQPASSGTSTTAWIVAGSAAALAVIGIAAWALLRRRRQPGERASAAYCTQHPEDSMCTAA
jgi:hypothetical protein